MRHGGPEMTREVSGCGRHYALGDRFNLGSR
jgi:hypothetical protein